MKVALQKTTNTSKISNARLTNNKLNLQVPFTAQSVKCTVRSMKSQKHEAFSLKCQAASTSEAAPATDEKNIPKSTTWELDFCSRPLLDERGKKIWELLICDSQRNFEYSQFFPNNKINSTEVCPTTTSVAAIWLSPPALLC